MNKKLHLLMGAAIACSALTAHAEKHYVPVTSVHQLVEGANYVICAVNSTWTNGATERYFTLVDVNGTPKVQALPYETDPENPTFDESVIWNLKAHTDMSCTNFQDDHMAYSPNKVFSMGKGDTNFIVQAAGNNLATGANLNVSAEANNSTAIEIVPVTTPSEYTGSIEQQFFALHGGYNDIEHEGEPHHYFAGVRAVNNSGEFNRYSNTETNPSAANYCLKVFPMHMDNNSWTTYYRIYLEVDTEHLEDAARAKWSELAANDYYEWLYAIDPLCGERYQEEFLNRFPTNLVRTMTIDNMTEKLTTAANQLAAQLDESTFFNTLVVNALNDINRAVTITNNGSAVDGTHLALAVSTDNTLISHTDASRTKWALELNDAGYILFRNRSTGLYIPPMPTTAGAAYGAMVSKEQAGPHQLNKSYDNHTWIHTADNHINADETTHRHMHSNNGGSNEQASVVAAGNSAKGAFSQWLLQSVPKASDEEIEFNNIRAHQADELNNLPNGVDGIWTAEQIAAVKAAIEAVTFNSDADSQEAELQAKLPVLQATLEAQAAALWENIDGKNVAIKFQRNSSNSSMTGSYWTVNDNNALVSIQNHLDASSVWQLKRLPGELMRFNIYNPATGKYLAGLAMTDDPTANETAYIIKPCTNTDYNTQYVIQCVDHTGNNYVHKEANSTATIWYTQNDQGSALRILFTDAQLAELKECLPAAPTAEIPAELLSETYELGKYSSKALGLHSATITSDNLPEFIANFNSATANIHSSYLYMPKDGTYFRVRTSTNNTNGNGNHSYILKHNPPVGNVFAFFTEETDDYSNTVFLYHDEHLVCVDNGLYMINHTNKNTFLSYASSVAENNPVQIRFVPGHNENGAYQIIMNSNRGLHIGNDGAMNMCSNVYPGIKGENAHNLELEQVTAIPVAIHSDGFGSIVTPAYVVAPSEESGAVAFVAQIDGTNLKFVEIPAGHLIAPNTHIVIKGNTETVNLETVAVPTEEHIISEQTCSDAKLEVAYGRKLITPGTNELIYVKSERPSTLAAGNAVRRRIDTTGAKFYLTKLQPDENNQVEIPGGSMAVRLTSENDDFKPEELEVSLSDGIPTGIEEISFDEVPAAAAEGIYDLQGRRLAAPVKGINIINGHKTFIR